LALISSRRGVDSVADDDKTALSALDPAESDPGYIPDADAIFTAAEKSR